MKGLGLSLGFRVKGLGLGIKVLESLNSKTSNLKACFRCTSSMSRNHDATLQVCGIETEMQINTKNETDLGV